MIKELKRVRGAVAKKDLIPILTHFHVYDGRIQGGNGRITIDSHCPSLKGFEFTVPADKFLRAVDACDASPTLNITKGGKLTVSKKPFRALLALEDHKAFPIAEALTDTRKTVPDLLPCLKTLQPFIGEDATRMWSHGMLLKNNFAYATNNVVLAKTPILWDGPELIIPSFAVDELIRIGKPVTSIAYNENHFNIFYDEDFWVRTQLIAEPWPSLDEMIVPCDTFPIPKFFKAGVEKILPFCPDKKFPRLCLNDSLIATDDGGTSASVDGPEFGKGYFRAEVLLDVLSRASEINFDNYPGPCYFKGDNIEGVMIGLLE